MPEYIWNTDMFCIEAMSQQLKAWATQMLVFVSVNHPISVYLTSQHCWLENALKKVDDVQRPHSDFPFYVFPHHT